MRIFLFVLLFACCSFSSVAAQKLSLAVLTTPNQRNSYYDIARLFTEESGIEINITALNDADYKTALEKWFRTGKDIPDVVYWQASQRLFYYAERDFLLPLTGLWEKESMDRHFSHIKSLVEYKGEIYGLPLSYYHWGIYYKRDLIEHYGGAPETWDAFLTICEQMKRDGISPIGIGTKNHWPAAAWFDYLNLRTNGLSFHKRVLQGEISFHDTRMQNVFSKWKELIEKGYFFQANREYSWDGMLPYLYRDKIGFFLIGNFVTTKLPEKMKAHIGFIPFPKMDEIPQYEEAPMEVLMIPKQTSQPEKAKQFIRFMARADIQSRLNHALGYLPPHNQAIVEPDYFIQEGAVLLQKASGLSQYFDRDTLPDFEKRAVPLFTNFINNGDIASLTRELEKARNQVWKE